MCKTCANHQANLLKNALAVHIFYPEIPGPLCPAVAKRSLPARRPQSRPHVFPTHFNVFFYLLRSYLSPLSTQPIIKTII